jgi:hypothetical protein
LVEVFITEAEGKITKEVVKVVDKLVVIKFYEGYSLVISGDNIKVELNKELVKTTKF